MLHAVIMAGGSGTRFWPASRRMQPKQLLNLVGDRTMIQATVDRLGDLVSPDRVLVVTNRRLVGQIGEQLPEMPAEAIIGEPCKRDTAPCIGLAASIVLRSDPDAVMVVMPADHIIESSLAFQEAIRQAGRLVEADPERIVTFGIRPTYPAEIFGYIERAEPLPDSDAPVSPGAPVFRVRQFREKPDAQQARKYCASGNYYWNSGIFVWQARTILDALERYEPEMHSHLTAIADAHGCDTFGAVIEREFAAIQGKSIDYAVMEHYANVLVIEAPFQWDDVGSWQALARMHGTDDQGNTLVGRHLALRTSNSIVRSDDDHLIVTVGLDNIIVVHTPDATLVANKDDEESIREIVKILEQKGWTEHL